MANETKLQCTLSNGYSAWVFECLQTKRGMKAHEIARRAWQEWVETNEPKLAQWGLSAEDWRRETGANVASISTERSRRQRGKSTVD